jgi:soluble cytochrome b562
MKSRILLTLVSAVAFAFTAVAADKDETPLSKNMSGINKSLRTVKRQLADASKKDENLALIEKVKKGIADTKDMEPKKTKDQSDKAAYTKKFHEEMDGLAKTVGELETAIKAGDADAAKKALDKIYQEKEKGHKDFGVDED